MSMSRRQFVRGTAVGFLGIAALPHARGADPVLQTGDVPLIISTWPFGKPSNDEALKVLSQGRSVLDAVEQGIRLAESTSPTQSVGLGGKPNPAGVLQLDACSLSGPDHHAGTV